MESPRKIITINGAPNTGKTTVAQFLTDILPLTVRLELDGSGVGHTTRRLPSPTSEHLKKLSYDTILADTASLAVNWVNRGCSVVLAGILHEKQFVEFRQHVIRQLPGYDQFYCFSLKPPLNVAAGNRGSREISAEETESIRNFYSWQYDPSYGVEIDNQSQTPEETAREIADHVLGRSVLQE